MILIGKSKEAFLKWAFEKYGLTEECFTIALETTLNALIIDFFDSVGIYILIDKINDNFWAKIKEDIPELSFVCKSNFRLEAINQAIEKSNKIYNLKHQ